MRPARVLIVAAVAVATLHMPEHAPPARAASQEVEANGWAFKVRNTPSDGLAITHADFQGTRVFRRISIPQIRVFYSVFPTMNDQIGQASSANVPMKADSLKVGIDEDHIDVRARYQESDWPDAGTYRYDVRYIFYSDGRFRPRVYAYGPGLEPTQRYEADIRIDLDVNGRNRDFFQWFRGGHWIAPRRECRCDDQGSHKRGAEWAVLDGGSGRVLELLPRDSDRRPSMWAVRWRDGEGNTDLGAAYAAPGSFNGTESIQFANVVLWYRSHAVYERPAGCPQDCTQPVRIGPTIRARRL